MKQILFVLATMALCTCSQSPKEVGSPGKSGNPVGFRFSTEPATLDARDPANWCNAQHGQALLINADPENFYRRNFALGDTPVRVIVDLGHQSAAFMLRRSGHQVEAFTSDNFPVCLSNKANFQISPDGLSLRYDNKKGVSCDLRVQEATNGLLVVLDLPAKGGHGLSVVGCASCR